MKLDVKNLGISGGGVNVVVLNEKTAISEDIHVSGRVKLENKKKEIIAVVDLSDTLVGRNEVGLFLEVSQKLKVKEGDLIHVHPVPPPTSVNYIKKKLDGLELTRPEIKGIINDIVLSRLSENWVLNILKCLFAHAIGTSHLKLRSFLRKVEAMPMKWKRV